MPEKMQLVRSNVLIIIPITAPNLEQ